MSKEREILDELDAIVYALFMDVSFRLWGHPTCKDNIRQIQHRIDAVKFQVLEHLMTPEQRLAVARERGLAPTPPKDNG